jgi:hypothetical protein
LKLLGYLLIMAAVVPLAGLAVTGGDWRAAWRYCKDWLRIVVATAVIGCILFLMLNP